MSKAEEPRAGKLTIPAIRARRAGPNLVMVATYDYPTARLCERAGVDMILVGDSLGMVALGYDTTVPVTLDDILHHCRAVVRGAPATHVVADMPYLTFQIDRARTIENAGRLIQQGGADSVKLEGGRRVAPMIEALTGAGIPVVGHVGLLPQRAGELGGFKVQGKDRATARAILDDAAAVADAGAFALVIEAVPAPLAALITERSPIPTIGIGAGPGCNGQVLLSHDLLGIEDRLLPRFVKRYADIGAVALDALSAFAAEVRDGSFPDAGHSYAMSDELIAEIREDSGRG
ncbi:MAG: 3-methyl-2-oxobutanoate hydroxymethyltransferase [Chloroflexota bacterium]